MTGPRIQHVPPTADTKPATVVPTPGTKRLAKAMIAEAHKQESGAEAVIVHFDRLQEGQCAALVGLLLDELAGTTGWTLPVPPPPKVRRTPPCTECGRLTMGRVRGGVCNACYLRARRGRERVA